MIEFRDRFARENGLDLLVHTNRARARRGHEPVRPGQQQVHAGHEDARAARCAPRGRLRRRVRRRAPRRGALAREGARLLVPRSRSASGTRRTSAPSCGTSTTARSRRARASASSRCRTGPSSTCGSTSGSRTSRSCRSTSRRARPVVERDGALIMVDDERLPLAPGEVPRDRERPLPHARLLPAHGRRPERRRRRCPRSSAR